MKVQKYDKKKRKYLLQKIGENKDGTRGVIGSVRPGFEAFVNQPQIFGFPIVRTGLICLGATTGPN